MSIPNEKDVVAQLAEAQTKLTTLQANYDAQAATIKQMTTDAVLLTTAKTDAETKLTAEQKKVADLTLSQADFNTKVAQKVQELGITHQAKAPEQAPKLTQEEAFKQYDDIKDPYEQGRFWDAHKQLLTGKE